MNAVELTVVRRAVAQQPLTPPVPRPTSRSLIYKISPAGVAMTYGGGGKHAIWYASKDSLLNQSVHTTRKSEFWDGVSVVERSGRTRGGLNYTHAFPSDSARTLWFSSPSFDLSSHAHAWNRSSTTPCRSRGAERSDRGGRLQQHDRRRRPPCPLRACERANHTHLRLGRPGTWAPWQHRQGHSGRPCIWPC